MVHKVKATGKMIEWGFDFTDVISDEAMLNLLKKFGFKKVYSEKPSDPVYRGAHDYTHEQMFGERFTEFMTTFENPRGIRITFEHMGGAGEERGALGYIGIKAPKSAEAELKSFLKEFRGSKPMPIDVHQTFKPKGIATYVKQENPYENPYIEVQY